MRKITIVFLHIVFSIMLASSLVAQEKPDVFIQRGHTDDVCSVSFSPDGRYLASGSDDSTIKIWDVATGREIKTLKGHSGNVASVCFSPDGKYLVSGSADMTVKLWDISTGSVKRTLSGHYHAVTSAVFSADGQYIASGSKDNTIKIWEVSTGKMNRSIIEDGNTVVSLAFSPDGRHLASGSADSTIRLWEVSTGKKIRTLVSNGTSVLSVSFSPNGKYLASGNTDSHIELWDLATGNVIRTLDGHSDWYSLGGEWIQSVAFSPDSRYLASGSRFGTIKLWEIPTGSEIRNIADGSHIYSITFSPDGRYIASGGGDNTAKIFDVITGNKVKTLTGNINEVNSVAFSPDGRHLASASNYDKYINLWEISTGRQILNFKEHREGVNAVVFSPDGQYIASGSEDRSIKLWEVSTGREIKTIEGYSSSVYSFSFSPDSRYIAFGSDNMDVKLYEVSSDKVIVSLSGHKDYIRSVSFSPDGKYLASGSGDSTVKLWEAFAGKEIRTFAGHKGSVESVCFSPDGRYLASASEDDTIRLWEISTGREFKVLSGHNDGVFSVCFSPDGQYLASGAGDGTIRLWEISTGVEIRRLTGHAGWISSVAFSPNGRFLASGSWDYTTRFWDINTGKEIAMLVNFADGEWIIMTPDGYFNCSPNGANGINVRIGMNIYSIDNFFETFYRPDIVKARLEGRSTAELVKKDITQGIRLPPQIELLVKRTDGLYAVLTDSQAKNVHIENGTIRVKVIAKDAGGGIKGVRLFNNGKSVGENIRGLAIVSSETVFEHEFAVSLMEGENLLKAVGFSLDMTESNPVTARFAYSSPKLTKPDMHVLAIGINEYRNSRYDLNYSIADMNGFVEALQQVARSIFGNMHVKMLANREANRANVLKAIEDIKTKAKTEDVFVLFYAGHGIALELQEGQQTKNEFYYVLSEVTQMTDPRKCAQEGISGTEMRSLLLDIKAGKQVLFVDACNSGAFASQFAARGAAEENALAKLSRATGSVIYASTTKEQFASEFEQLKHGAFTYVVIEALGGKASLPNGQITVSSLKAYIDDKIPEITKQYKGDEQYPTTFIWGQDFPIGVK